jgi:hypothetical protein
MGGASKGYFLKIIRVTFRGGVWKRGAPKGWVLGAAFSKRPPLKVTRIFKSVLVLGAAVKDPLGAPLLEAPPLALTPPLKALDCRP